ncbi:MAG: UvrD-helicase domain-containing protein, partial [Candidatus Acidiferrales bacterium]
MGRLLEMPRPAGSDPELNPQQQSAVNHDGGPLLVVAGAGTGKTRVITERIRRLLAADPDLPAESILGLTFTDKAAGEMKHRVIVAAGERGKDVWLSTFHDFCLKRIIRELNPGVQLLDEYDHWILLRRNLPLLQLSYFRRIAEPGQFLGDFCDFFSRCQDELVSPDDYDAYVRREEESFQRQREQLNDELRANWTEKITREKELARAYRA